MYGIAWSADTSAFQVKGKCFNEENKFICGRLHCLLHAKTPNWLNITSRPSYTVNLLLEFFSP